MFEYEQEIVNALLSENENFKRLYSRHGELKEKVKNANSGAAPIDGYALDNLKKEKLYVKDKLAAMINNYRQNQFN